MEIENTALYTKRNTSKEKNLDHDSNEERQIHNYEDLSSKLKSLKMNVECPTLKDLINGLYELYEKENVNIDAVQALMYAYKSNPAEWLKYAKFDRFKYTRNLVDAGNGKFNLMILCWGEGHGTSIHDHANAHCVMKILAGNLCEVRFKWPEKDSNNQIETDAQMEEISRTVLPTNGICYINDSLGLHRVENLSYSDCAVSLHLYSPPFDTCKVFNERTGHSVKTTSTFWSVYGKRRKDKKLPVTELEDN